jgi:hypothetical protein
VQLHEGARGLWNIEHHQGLREGRDWSKSEDGPRDDFGYGVVAALTKTSGFRIKDMLERLINSNEEAKKRRNPKEKIRWRSLPCKVCRGAEANIHRNHRRKIKGDLLKGVETQLERKLRCGEGKIRRVEE